MSCPALATPDGFICEQSTVTFNSPHIVRCTKAAATLVTLATFLTRRHVAPNKPIPRPHLTSRDKLTSKGGLAGSKNFFG